jgi:hypothetical protein
MGNKLGIDDDKYRAILLRSIRNMEINSAIGAVEEAERWVREASGTSKGKWGAAMGILADAKLAKEAVLTKWSKYL